MKYSFAKLVVICCSISLFSGKASAEKHNGHIVVPASSIAPPGNAGQRAHTNIRYFVPDAAFTDVNPLVGPPYAGYGYETPASLACLYRLTAPITGCNPNVVTANPSGGGGSIAIVDAYDDPTAIRDLAAFSQQFGIVANKPFFEVVFANGNRPPQDPTGGWELEESLDIEYAHAMAPNAKLYLVEAASNSNSDLFKAIQVASALVAAAGGGEVSMSWGEDEYASERDDDAKLFSTSGVVYFASTGDSEGVEYPSTSPEVVAAGGTTNSRNPFTLAFQKETGWNYAGGGPSAYEPRPHYQDSIASVVGSARGVPDISFNADPDSGVWIMDSNPVSGEGGPGSWWIVGGTSVSSPSLAGIANRAGRFATSSRAELTDIYDKLASPSFTDVTAGTCYYYNGFSATVGWDFCTGVGTVRGAGGE